MRFRGRARNLYGHRFFLRDQFQSAQNQDASLRMIENCFLYVFVQEIKNHDDGLKSIIPQTRECPSVQYSARRIPCRSFLSTGGQGTPDQIVIS